MGHAPLDHEAPGGRWLFELLFSLRHFHGSHPRWLPHRTFRGLTPDFDERRERDSVSHMLSPESAPGFGARSTRSDQFATASSRTVSEVDSSKFGAFDAAGCETRRCRRAIKRTIRDEKPNVGGALGWSKSKEA
jgi:hypothetical protein